MISENNSSNAIKEEACPACGCSDNSTLFSSVPKDYSFDGFVYLKCKDCESIFLQVPNQEIKCQEDASKFHENYWREVGAFSFQPKLNFDERLAVTRELAKIYHKTFEELVPNDSYKVLDFGCGEGHLVTALIEMGIDAYGIEPDAQALEQARLRIPPKDKEHFFVGSAETLYTGKILQELKVANIQSNEFEIIILKDVLEHIYEPVKFLASLNTNLLKSNGFIWISVPSAHDKQIEYLNKYAWSVMAPFHRILFSSKGLTHSLSLLDFEVIKSFSNLERWGWTRALAWKAGFASEHEKLRLTNPEFKKYDFLVDKLFNQIVFNNSNSVDLEFIVKKRI